MPKQTAGDVHVSQALTNVSVAYRNDASAFVFSRAFAQIPVANQAGQYHVWTKADLLRSDAQQRAPGAPAARSAPGSTTAAYFADRYAIGAGIPDPIRRNADPALNLEVQYTEALTGDLMIRREVDWASTFFAAAIWDGASSSTDMTGQAAPASTATNFLQWNDPASVPIEDIHGEADSIMRNNGTRPNRLIVGSAVHTALRNHPDILDRIKHTQRGVVTEDLLAQLFDVESYMVMRATRNTATEGATASYSFIGGTGALLCYANPGAATNQPSAGYTFTWNEAGGMDGLRVKRYRDEEYESDIVEVESWWDDVVVASGLGAFFVTAVAS